MSKQVDSILYGRAPHRQASNIAMLYFVNPILGGLFEERFLAGLRLNYPDVCPELEWAEYEQWFVTKLWAVGNRNDVPADWDPLVDQIELDELANMIVSIDTVNKNINQQQLKQVRFSLNEPEHVTDQDKLHNLSINPQLYVYEKFPSQVDTDQDFYLGSVKAATIAAVEMIIKDGQWYYYTPNEIANLAQLVYLQNTKIKGIACLD